MNQKTDCSNVIMCYKKKYLKIDSINYILEGLQKHANEISHSHSYAHRIINIILITKDNMQYNSTTDNLLVLLKALYELHFSLLFYRRILFALGFTILIQMDNKEYYNNILKNNHFYFI